MNTTVLIISLTVSFCAFMLGVVAYGFHSNDNLTQIRMECANSDSQSCLIMFAKDYY